MVKPVPNQTIHFYYQVNGFAFVNRNKLKAFILMLCKREQILIQSLDYIFCTDDYLLEINIRFLSNHDYTDIISFNLSDNDKSVKGEIYISMERVKENAKQLNLSFQNELTRVLFHGALHLCGFEDATPSQKQAMRAKEDQYMFLFNKFIN